MLKRVATTIFFLLMGIPVAPALAQKDDPAFFKFMYKDKTGNRMPYRLYMPPSYDATKKYPLVVWLHDEEGRGYDNIRQISKGNELGAHIWTKKENQAQFPAFVLAPQCSSSSNWGNPELNEINQPLKMALDILATVQKDYSIDPDRLILAGQSMGGLGVWALLQSQPGHWAAALSLASYDDFTNVQAVAPVPLWMFQGDSDLTVPVDLVRIMIRELKKAGSQVRYSEYRNSYHDVWKKAFAEPELVPWVAAQKRRH